MDDEDALDRLRTPRDLIRWGASRFREAGLCYGHGTDNAIDEAAQLVLHALHLPYDLPSTYLQARLLPTEVSAALELLRRRLEGRIPAPYLTGEAWFAGLPFHVDERVLIPRSPIAELIEQQFALWFEDEPPRRILDLCTGSGCIAVACAVHMPDARVDASDISDDALAVARRNVARHGVGDRVAVVKSDLFSALAGRRYDLIVSNPPYVPEAEVAELPAEFGHEPALALAAGEHGLDVVVALLEQAGEHLEPHGVLVVEVGQAAAALAQRFPGLPLTWLDFERGGEGVFALYADELQAWLGA